MAIIDLRNAAVFLRDGTVLSHAGAVNHGAGYPIGTTTMTVDGFTVALDLGQGFTIGGTGELYSIIAHTETALVTTSITFTPPLTSSVLDDAVINVIGNIIEFKIGEGTLTYSEKRGVTYVLNRGRIYTVKLGDDAPVDVSVQFIWEFLRSAVDEPPTIEEAFKQIGGAADWISSSPDPCEPYALDIVICNQPPCIGESETITLNSFRFTDLDHDLKAGQVSVKGSCNIAFATVEHFGG